MEIHIKDMDIRPIHSANIERRKRQVLPLYTMGLHAEKRGWVRHAFDSVNFSFVLRGGGQYRKGGLVFEVQAPCVLTQWPGEFVEYGVTDPWESWDEIYFIYKRELAPLFVQSLMINREYPIWPIDNVAEVGKGIAELAKLSRMPAEVGWVERVDLLCERIIMESRPSGSLVLDPSLRQIYALKAEVERSFATIKSVDALAVKFGLSRSSFRRLWMRISDMPPGRHLVELRLKYACRLLVETREPIGAIAERVGFEDPLYFSRKFRQTIGMTASAYRRENTPR